MKILEIWQPIQNSRNTSGWWTLFTTQEKSHSLRLTRSGYRRKWAREYPCLAPPSIAIVLPLRKSLACILIAIGIMATSITLGIVMYWKKIACRIGCCSSTVSESLALKDRILLEPVSSEHEYLPTVIEAMRRSVRIKVAYQRYGTDNCKDLCFEPYCIKLFNRRWYVLGHYLMTNLSDYTAEHFFGVFAFDRIRSLSLTDIKFTIDPNFDAEAYFEECFGVVVHDDTMAERIVIRAFGQERFYLKDLPLHHSQREIAQGDDYTDFELHLRPTMDFCNCLLSHGCHIKVLSPERLALEIFEMHAEAAQLYGIDAKGFYE